MLKLKQSFNRVHHVFIRYSENFHRNIICLNCYHRFADNYGCRSNNYNPQSTRNVHVYCPFCGHQYFHQEYYKIDERNFGLWDLKISLYMFKEKIKIVLTGQICRMSGKLFEDTCEKVEEKIEFDIGKRLTTFKQTRETDSTDEVSFELGNPIHLDRFSKLSLLNNIMPQSMVYKDSFWTKFLKDIREGLMKRLINKHYLYSKSWYDTYDTYSAPKCGKVLPSLFNYAFRMRHPSFKNFNFNSRFTSLEQFLPSTFDTFAIPLNVDHSRILCKSTNLPYSRELRAYIAEDFNRFILLYVLNQKFNLNSCDLLLDTTMLEKFLHHLHHLRNDSKYYYQDILIEEFKKSTNDLITFLVFLQNKFKTVSFSKLLQIEEFNDCLSMFTDLPSIFREKFLADKIRTREVHDRLIRLTNQLNTIDYNLQIPESVVNRFLMQRDRLKAFIPENSSSLYDAGRKMHICVGSY